MIYELNMFAFPLHGTTHRLHQLSKVFLRNKAHIVFIYLLIYRMPQFTLRIVLHHKLHQYTNLDIQRKITFFFPRKLASVHILLSIRYTLINMFFIAGSSRCREFSVGLLIVDALSHMRMILPQVHLRKPCYDFSFL